MATSKVTKIEFNSAAFAALLQSPPVRADIERRANAIAQAAGEGVGVRVTTGRTRVRATVMTETYEARAREATDKTLTSAIGAGRG